ncbi:MAG TPA: phosphotransferase [Stellaceae bacterium]|nr:phosphotransferase [Stellaceae bacterium]
MIEADDIADADLDADMRRIANLALWRGGIRLEILPGGLSNRNFIVRDGEDAYVARLVGGDDAAHGIVRAREIAVSRAAHRAGIAPELVHAEPGLLVLRLVAGRTLTAPEVADPAMLRRIAALLRRCHGEVAAHLRGPAPCFWVFHALRDYLAALAGHGMPGGRIERLRDIAEALEAAVGPTRLTLTHNDLMPGNLIDDGEKLWLIDWEYGGFGAPLFDLASLVVDNALDAAAQETLLAAYFRRAPSASLRRRFAAMILAADLREALWARVQQIDPKLDFDYAGYAAEYEARFESGFAAFALRARREPH